MSRTIGYGLLALQRIEAQGAEGLTTARKIAEYYGMPFDPLARTLQRLQRHGVLTAVKGVQGGYRISADLDALSFDAFVGMIVGKRRLIECMGGDKCCLVNQCAIAEPMVRLNNKIHHFMDGISVRELIKAPPARLTPESA